MLGNQNEKQKLKVARLISWGGEVRKKYARDFAINNQGRVGQVLTRGMVMTDDRVGGTLSGSTLFRSHPGFLEMLEHGLISQGLRHIEERNNNGKQQPSF